jgi:hypothetical protein
MFLRGGKTLVGAAMFAAVLAIALAAPAGAAPWGGWGEARELMGSFLPRVLAWLTPASNPGSLKCDQGSQIDPNGCPKATSHPGSIGPRAVSPAGSRTNDDGPATKRL